MTKNRIVLALTGFAAAIALTACGAVSDSKYVEQYKDAKIESVNEAPAHKGTMPDGFSNWAAKCDGPNMVYVIFHYSNNNGSGNGDQYGAISVVPNDPRCTQS